MIRISDVSIKYYEDMEALKRKVLKILGVSDKKLNSFKISKKSLDARRKKDIKYIYSVDVCLNCDEISLVNKINNSKVKIHEEFEYKIPKVDISNNKRPVVVGFGPAGMFASLVLAEAGMNPIILERGEDVDTRSEKVERFWSGSALDVSSNVQFGEGGAGTFSDGKLNTGVKNERISWILNQFVKHGANENIIYDAKPHIGTDILKKVVKSIRNRIIDLGGEILFSSKFSDFDCNDDKIISLLYERDGNWNQIECDDVILSLGHSARDTFVMLNDKGLNMEAKTFSMGVRIEHEQSMINLSQYGGVYESLPNADYKLSCHINENESAYTFCMCPGGYVVGATSEENCVVTNGMSYQKRDGKNANSALLVTIRPDDFPIKSVLGGMYWQRELEQKAFEMGGSTYFAPAQLLGDFMIGKKSERFGKVKPTYRPGVTFCDLNELLPKKISRVLKQAIPELDKKLNGFLSQDAILTAIETRSSSPVRIIRNQNTRESTSVKGIYPAGEGAGYAGGIMSAAIDGMLSAEAIIKKRGDLNAI